MNKSHVSAGWRFTRISFIASAVALLLLPPFVNAQQANDTPASPNMVALSEAQETVDFEAGVRFGGPRPPGPRGTCVLINGVWKCS